MNTIAAIIKRHALAAFFVLAYAISWALVALVSRSVAFALLALFGPALAAIIVTAASEGRRDISALLRRVVLWRVGVRWYLVAIGLPFAIAALALGVHSLVTGAPFALSTGTSIPLLAVLAVLVVGEEIGWRGYALPHLQARYSGLVASLILGVLWAGWHLANGTIPGLQAYWYGFPAFLFFVVAQTILFTWLFNHSRGSVLLAWIFHASINVSNALFYVGDQVTQWWFVGAGYAVVAVIVVLMDGADLARAALAVNEDADL